VVSSNKSGLRLETEAGGPVSAPSRPFHHHLLQLSSMEEPGYRRRGSIEGHSFSLLRGGVSNDSHWTRNRFGGSVRHLHRTGENGAALRFIFEPLESRRFATVQLVVRGFRGRNTNLCTLWTLDLHKSPSLNRKKSIYLVIDTTSISLYISLPIDVVLPPYRYCSRCSGGRRSV
jgi:hypothetical protein